MRSVRYRKVHDDQQEVMLGYSDSGKDAGRAAAAWALYRCQEDLVQVLNLKNTINNAVLLVPCFAQCTTAFEDGLSCHA